MESSNTSSKQSRFALPGMALGRSCVVVLANGLDVAAEKLHRLIACAFVVSVIAAFAGVSSIYAFVLHPLIRDLLRATPGLLFAHQCMSIWLLTNAFLNYIMALIISPGIPPPADAEAANLVYSRLPQSSSHFHPSKTHALALAATPALVSTTGSPLVDPDTGDNVLDDGPHGPPYLTPSQRWRWCKTCRAPKPPRAHHDRVTGVCVLQMCHYCPVVANCVGLCNYQYFARFIAYTWSGMLFCAATCAWIQSQHGPDAFLDSRTGDVVFFSTVGATAIGVAVGVLAAFHVYLVCSGQTTIECYENWSARRAGLLSKPPFDAGIRGNVARSFGKPYLSWLPWWSVLFLPDVRRIAVPAWMQHPSSVTLTT